MAWLQAWVWTLIIAGIVAVSGYCVHTAPDRIDARTERIEAKIERNTTCMEQTDNGFHCWHKWGRK